MRVQIYDVTDKGRVLTGECDLAECFPDDDDDKALATCMLLLRGWYRCGGGAAPLTELLRVDPLPYPPECD